VSSFLFILVLGLENNLIAFWDAQVNTKKSRSTTIEGGQYYMVLGGVSLRVIG
jgi:hypothetical protein